MADLKPISQFATASSVEANTLLFVSTPNQNNGYDSEKVSAGELGEALVNDFEYTQDLSTVSKKVTGAINENKSVIGYSYDEYDDTTTSANAYAVDDLCIQNNTLYKCIAPTYGAWDSSKWESTSIADEIGRIDTALSGKQDTLSFGSLTNTDLDTLRTNGYYYLSGLSSTHHAPCSYGVLEVIATAITLQRVTQVGPTGTSATQYERIYINSAWTTWRTITRS